MSNATSPFKFLDSYQQEDRDIFFGREKETDALYNALSGVKHLLVYGPSGAGKTSLVECGLRNQFSDADWYALTIRRSTNMTASVFGAINEALQEKLELDTSTKLPIDGQTDFGQAIENLFSERYQPVYLLFDQFEELLISGAEDEKRDFFTRLNQLIRYKVPCRVMLIMREEFIGHLSEFELLCPSIFQHRFRLEKMRKENVKEVIHQTLDAPKYRNAFDVEDSETLATGILSKLPDKQQEIELAHVQVFLGELWERANLAKTNNSLPLLHQGLIKPNDNLEGVLDSFLNNQLKELEISHGEKVPLELLACMISERHTKLQASEADLQKDLDTKEVVLNSSLHNLLRDLELRRILRTLKAGEQTQYEISHDVLALVVGRNLTDEMKLREKAADIYRVYEERQGFFSQEDLDYMRPYQQYKAYSSILKQRVKESEDHIHTENLRREREKDEQLKEAQQRANQERQLRALAEQAKIDAETQRNISERRLKTMRGLFMVVGLTLLFAAYFWNLSREKTLNLYQTSEKANKLLSENIIKDSLNRIEKYNRFIAEANDFQSKEDFDKAIERFKIAIEFATDTTHIVIGIEACRAAKRNLLEVEQRIQQAEAQTKLGNYPKAILAYSRALDLGVNPYSIKAKLKDLKTLLEKKAGDEERSAEALSFDPLKAKAYKKKVEESRKLVIQIQKLLKNNK